MEATGYPKKFMSKVELMEIGMPRRMIEEISHLKDGKATIRRGRGGKCIFDTGKLDADIARWKRLHHC